MRVSLMPTGQVMAFLAVFLLGAAMNTGNNLLFLLSAGMFAVLVVARGAAKRNLRGVRFAVPPDQGVFSGTDLEVPVVVEAPEWSLVKHLMCGDEAVLELPMAGRAVFHPVWRHSVRGRYQIDSVRVFSTFPFGLLRAEMLCPPIPVWNYPRPVATQFVAEDEGLAGRVREWRRVQEGEFWSLREYVAGDDARLINWMVSARTDQEWITENILPAAEPIRLWVAPMDIPADCLEDFVSRLAGFVLETHAGRAPIAIWGLDSQRAPAWIPVSSEEGLGCLLRWLAVFGDGSLDPPPPPLGELTPATHKLRPGNFPPSDAVAQTW